MNRDDEAGTNYNPRSKSNFIIPKHRCNYCGRVAILYEVGKWWCSYCYALNSVDYHYYDLHTEDPDPEPSKRWGHL